jgi:tyrosyl-tRNA synthetase
LNRRRHGEVLYGATQRRTITLNWLRKTEEAKEQWAGWAEEINQGKKQSFVSMLKERGYIHDVVGG